MIYLLGAALALVIGLPLIAWYLGRDLDRSVSEDEEND